MDWLDLRQSGFELTTRQHANGQYLFVLRQIEDIDENIDVRLKDAGFKSFSFGYAAPITYLRGHVLKNLPGAQKIDVDPEEIGYITREERLRRERAYDNQSGMVRTDGEGAPTGVPSGTLQEEDGGKHPGSISSEDRGSGEGEDSGNRDSDTDKESDPEDSEFYGESSTHELGEQDSGESGLEGVGVPRTGTGARGLNERHFFIPDDLFDQPGSRFVPREKAHENIEVIRLVKELEFENREATYEEKKILAHYNGWGGIPQAFDYVAWGRDIIKELEELLSEEEINQIESSINTAFFTPAEVVKGIWSSIQDFGFTGGKILEPSVGTGNFFGFAPPEIVSRSQFVGIENDPTTASIAKAIYPDADIRAKGFEKTNFPNNFFDLVLTNVPYGDFHVFDTEYSKQKFRIHDYFIAKSLDKLKPGRIGAFITSSFTLDKQNDGARKEMASKGDLVGAIRLPSSAFSSHAGTQVVTDVLFFVGREQPLRFDETPSWIHSTLYDASDDIYLNQFFIDNPDLIVGTIQKITGRYGPTLSIVPPDNYENKLYHAFKKIGERMPSQSLQDANNINLADQEVENVDDEKIEGEFYHDPVGTYILGDNNDVYRITRSGDEGIAQHCGFTGKKLERMRSLIGIRETAKEVIRTQKESRQDTPEYLDARTRLNEIYDDFISKNDYINKPVNRKLFQEDPRYGLIMALENYDEQKQTATKADIFFERVISSPELVTHVDTVHEGLLVVLDKKGQVDISEIASLVGKDEKETLEELVNLDAIYHDPEKARWVHSSEYLSGDVRHKLERAIEATSLDSSYNRNVRSLEMVKPKDKTPSEIDIKLGVPWVSTTDVEEFVAYMLDVNPGIVNVECRSTDGEWVVDAPNFTNHLATKEYGTERRNFLELLRAGLSQKTVQVYDTYYEDDKPKRILNYQETVAAEEKLDLIQEKFRKFIWEHDEDRCNRVVEEYNRRNNNYVPPKYDGSHLSLPGMSNAIIPRNYQKDAIWRLLHKNELIAHEVGLGKTLVQVSGAMEMKRLGKANKPLIVIPNYMLKQIDREARQIYPDANILAVTKDDLVKQNRQKFIGKVSNNNWDLVVATHSMFEKIKNDPKFEKNHTKDILSSYKQELENSDSNRSRKDIQKKIKTLESKLEALSHGKEKDEIYIDDLGIDTLFIDEAHKYKNLQIVSSSSDISNAIKGSKRAWDLYLKTQWIYDKRGEEYGIHFATGTPVTNNPFEIYNMQRYLQPSILESSLTSHANSWAANFLQQKTTWEPNHAGTGWKRRTRHSLCNIPELMQMFQNSMDLVKADDVGVTRPEPIKHNIVAELTETQRKLMQDLDEQIQEGVHVFSVMHQGKVLALDPRIFGPEYEDEADTKINLAVKQIYQIWDDSKAEKGAQLVFCDLSIPQKNGFNVYDDVREKLMEMGVPKEEVAFIHEYPNDNQKAQLFSSVRQGDTRILMGSTAKMGEGMNVQDHLVALHHLDAPWTPASVEQREGRIIRFGNERDNVDIYIYTTEDTFDLFLWNLLKLKNEQFSKILSGETNIRRFDFEIDPSYAETAAITSGNPKIKEKLELEHEKVKLESLAKHHSDSVYKSKKHLRIHESNLEGKKQILDEYKKVPSPASDPAKWNINLQKYGYESDFEGSREKMLPILKNLMNTQQLSKVDGMSCGGIPVSVARSYDPEKKEIVSSWRLEVEPYLIRKNSAGIEKLFAKKDQYIKQIENEISDIEKEVESLNLQLQKPFEHQEKLLKTYSRLRELDREIARANDKAQNHAEGGKEEDDLKNEQDMEDMDSLPRASSF